MVQPPGTGHVGNAKELGHQEKASMCDGHELVNVEPNFSTFSFYFFTSRCVLSNLQKVHNEF